MPFNRRLRACVTCNLQQQCRPSLTVGSQMRAPRQECVVLGAVLCCAVLCCMSVCVQRITSHRGPRRRVAWKRFTFEILSVGKIMKTPS